MSNILSPVLDRMLKAIVLIDRRGWALGEHSNPICQKSDRHGHVEDGEMWLHNGIHPSLANGATADHLLRVGAESIHIIQMDPHAQQSPVAGPITVTLYEAPTTTADGDPGAMRNRNRNYPDTSPPFLVFENPTVTAIGTEVQAILLTGSIQAGRGDAQDLEWVLKPNTDYLIRLPNNSGGAIDAFTLDIEGYAETVPTPLPHQS